MVLLNGIETSQISVFDRGMLYGQSVFETIAISRNRFCLLESHLERLDKGCDVLGIPLDLSALMSELDLFSNTIEASIADRSVLRITVTMGEGGRGYLNPVQPCVNRILSLHDYPNHPAEYWTEGVKVGLSSIKLAKQPLLAGIKHGNRLEQTMARALWQADWQEALLCDYTDNVIEATQSNVFIVKNGLIKTPSLSNCGVAGVMRDYIIEQAHKLGIEVQIVSLSVQDFAEADEFFVSNSVIGLWPVKQFQKNEFSDFKVTNTLLKSIINNEVIPNF